MTDASRRTQMAKPRQTTRLIGFLAESSTGILTRRIGNSSLLGVTVWLPSDSGATSCCGLLPHDYVWGPKDRS